MPPLSSLGYAEAREDNRTISKVDDFVNGEAKGRRVIGAHSVEELVRALKRPRRVMLMVKAGQAVDDFIVLFDQGAFLAAASERRQ